MQVDTLRKKRMNTDVKEQRRLEQQASLLNSPLDNAKAGIELTSLSLSCLGCHCCVQDSLALGQGLFRLAPSGLCGRKWASQTRFKFCMMLCDDLSCRKY